MITSLPCVTEKIAQKSHVENHEYYEWEESVQAAWSEQFSALPNVH